jgi:DNA repair protein RadA/Sms
MARKPKSQHVCTACGSIQPRWLGQCPECEAWNTLEEEVATGAAPPGRGSRAVPSDDVPDDRMERVRSGIGELDRVLGGGCVPGSVVLVGGEPGVGKSTLMLQAAGSMARSGLKVLYATGEESVAQVAGRARRLGCACPELLLLSETSLETVLAQIRRSEPAMIVLDSVQTVRCSELESAPGTVGQVRAAAAQLADHARLSGAAVFLVGHVTKEGTLAGPKLLEHMVDVVLYFEGETTRHYRVVRNAKNRFGATHEIGVFEMTGRGLVEVAEPSGIFLDQDRPPTPGVAIHAGAEGGRGLVMEIQALVTPAGFGTARRSLTGLDAGRVSLVLAVLDRKAGVHVLDQDVFVNAPGGLRVVEPAADLAVAAAVLSAVTGEPCDRETAWAGELGLTGEVRWVGRMQPRVAEVRKLGLRRLVVPESNLAEASRLAGEQLAVESLSDVTGLLQSVAR